MKRCPWSTDNELLIRYHDTEWGVPVHDDRKHFEFLVLESAQAGLSWLTILKRREGYRRAYSGFDPEMVAAYDEKKIAELLQDTGIIRNRRKIEASIVNARRLLEIRKSHGSFDAYIWGFVKNKPVVNRWKTIAEIPAKTELSDAVAKDLKKRGFQFVGSTIMYSHLQAVGIVNDHVISCGRYREINRLEGKAPP
jgi:DNA-3-methyladenine glycosylase I